MPSSAQRPDWDIFCTVIDNYGDIGVCWRLARQLTDEHKVRVRLWVDALTVFQHLCPQIDPLAAVQECQGIEVRHWPATFPQTRPARIVLETFACHLPESFLQAMEAESPKPVWINLEYLSAESWVSGCHALPSPHPRLSLCKTFFFPGFAQSTGGLLRERYLLAARESFCASPVAQNTFWQTLGLPLPPEETLKISLFSYENSLLTELLDTFAGGRTPVCCFIPLAQRLPAIESMTGHHVRPGDIIRRRNLELRLLPFVEQTLYDRLLWSCDINLVRGEDSFVRAQWAAKPMLWQIYPQDDDAHHNKLYAFLDAYCAGLSPPAGKTVRQMHERWNAMPSAAKNLPDALAAWSENLPELRLHARNWAEKLARQQDLCSNLVRFCHSKL